MSTAVRDPWTPTSGYRPGQLPNQERLRRRYSRWTLGMSVLNVTFSVGLVFLLTEISENWWFSGALIYIPQTPLLIPSICLMFCSLAWHLRSMLLNLTSFGLILFCLCGVRFSMKPLNEVVDSPQNVKVVTCNVQNFQPNFGKVLREIARVDPDVIALQEAFEPPQILFDSLEGWHWHHDHEYYVGSRWPLRAIGLNHTGPYERSTVLKVEIDAPFGPLLLSNVHLMTARRGLTDLSVGSILNGEGPASVDNHSFLRFEEASQSREFVSSSNASVPHIVVGDFNMPTTSNIFHDNFGDLTNAFDEAGIGFGYTAPCRPVRFWLPGVPWLRIDHILMDEHWEAVRCETGEFNGSDHRLVSAVLKLRPENSPPP